MFGLHSLHKAGESLTLVYRRNHFAVCLCLLLECIAHFRFRRNVSQILVESEQPESGLKTSNRSAECITPSDWLENKQICVVYDTRALHFSISAAPAAERSTSPSVQRTTCRTLIREPPESRDHIVPPSDQPLQMLCAMLAFAPPVHGLPRQRHCTRGATCGRRAPRMVSADASSPPSSRPGMRQGEIEVRFINTPDGEDVIAAAREGDLLLGVGDSVGLRIPRACVSGLCGSCTVDIVDAEGAQTVRACQTRVVDIGTAEMVVDVARMREVRERRRTDPMARFNNMDTEYVAFAQPVQKKGWRREMDCVTCGAAGDVECYSCDGTGTADDEDETMQMCLLCAGSGTLRCADCQGVGVIKVG